MPRGCGPYRGPYVTGAGKVGRFCGTRFAKVNRVSTPGAARAAQAECISGVSKARSVQSPCPRVLH